MIYKYNIDQVKNAVTSKCHLCLHGEWQRKVSTSLNTRHSVQFSTVAHCMLWTLYALAAANSWYMFCSDITQAFTYGKLDVLLYCLQPPGFERPKGTIFGCTNDLAMYSSFGKRLEKKFYLKSDDHIDVYLGNSIVQDRAKGTVTTSQEHYLMACLEEVWLNGLQWRG